MGSSVISLRELKVDYKTFESKTALCHRHEMFLADDRIIRFLPQFLEKAFYKRKKFPMAIDMTSPNLAKIVQKALQTVTLPLHNQGVCTMVRLGHTNMPENHLVDNILAASEILIKKYPGGFKNIRSLMIKTETSLALPIHLSTLSANEVGFVDTFKPKEEKKEDITDEEEQNEEEQDGEESEDDDEEEAESESEAEEIESASEDDVPAEPVKTKRMRGKSSKKQNK